MRLATKGTETEDLFQTLANKSPVGLYIVQDGKFCYTNPAFQSSTGYTEDGLLGRDSLELVVPEDRERVRENAIKMLKGELTPPYQFRVTHKNDSIRWIIESVVSIRHRGRRATLGSFVDITERKQTEEALQAEKNKLQSLIDTIEYTITIQDPEYNIIYQNEPSKIASGGDHRGEKCYRAYEGRETVCDGCAVEKAFKDGKSHTSERSTAISGKVAFWENTATPIRDAGGRVVACLELARDITERKRGEEARREAEEEKSALLEEAPVGIIHADLKGKITYVNKRFESESGYSREEITGKSGFQLDWFPAGTTKYLAKRMAARLRGGPAKYWETQFKCKDGRWIWIELEGKILKRLGVPVGFQIIARNITERKRMEEALQAEKNKLQSLIDAVEYIITIRDTEYNIIYENEPARIVFGGDHLGEKCYRVYEDREKVCDGCPVDEAFKDGKSHTMERRLVIPSGEVIFLEITANPIRDAGGRIISCLELAKDVTERKKQEQALKDSEENYRELANSITDVFFAIDKHLRYTYWNKASEILIGIGAEDALGKSLLEIFPDTPGLRRAEKVYRDVLRTQQPQTFVNDFDIDGRHYIFEISAYPSRGGISVFARDITERKQAEKALQAEKNKLQSIMDAMEDHLTIRDKDYNLIYQGEPSKKIFGDHLGEKCYRVYEGRDSICEDCPAEKAFKDGKSHTSERKTATPSGEVVFWENTANPIRDAEGRIVACLELARDITDRKKAEEELSKTQAQLSSAVQIAHLGPWEYDAINDLFIFNDAFYELFHTTAEEVGGYTMSSAEYARRFVYPEDAHLVSEEVRKALQADDPNFRSQLDHRIIYANGEVGYISVRFFIVKDKTGGTVRTYGVNQDITERKQAEEALQAEKNKLQSLIDTMADGLTIQDRDYNIIFQNEPSRKTTGGDRVGEKCYQVFEGQEKVCDGCPVEKAFKDGQPHVAERRRVLPSGEVSFWENTANPIRDADGKIVACLEIGRNITERKKQEQALADELTRRRLLVDQSLDGIVVLDVDAKVVEANQRFAEMLGYTLEEVYELHTWDWDKQFPPEKLLEIGRGIDEKGLHLETKHTRKDGSVIDVDISISAIMYGGQKLIFCVQRDVTTRKKMEEALRMAAEEWKRTFDSITDAISIHDNEFRILRANKAFADLFKKSPNQIIGKYCYELHIEGKPISDCPHQQTLATGRPAAAEFYESHLGKYLRASTSPIFNEKCEVVGTVHIIRDITAQKQQNERLMMAERLASIGELASGTAHELNNPLTSVIGFSQLLIEKEIPEDIREDVKSIYDEAQRAVNVTKNLLTFARKHAPVKHLNQINNIIDDVLKLRAYENKVNNIEVKKHLAPDLPEIRVDYFQMQQAFMNIIINAEYFMTEAHKGGTLTVTTKKQNSTVMISFADDGPGIPPENLRRIFDPFFTTKEAGKGTGLGLSICHGIVTEHGGQIYANSQPGKGATIFVELPINSS